MVGIVPVDRKLDLKALARAAGGKKAAMAEPAAAERATGYVVGGISPLGQKTRHTTVLDESAEAYDVVYVSGGRRGLDVGLAPADLLTLTGGTTAPIAAARRGLVAGITRPRRLRWAAAGRRSGRSACRAA